MKKTTSSKTKSYFSKQTSLLIISVIIVSLFVFLSLIAASNLANQRTKLNFSSADSAAAATSTINIDALVLYTNAANIKVPDIKSRVVQDILNTNQALKFSNASVRLELIGLQKISYTEDPTFSTETRTILERMNNAYDSYIPEAQTLRNSLGADVVFTYVHIPPAACGSTNRRTASSSPNYNLYAHSVINVSDSCSWSNWYTFAHEFVHMFGMYDTENPVDSLAVASDVRPFANATIEEIVSSANKRRINLYSNPDLTVEGVRFGTPGVSNSVRLINRYGPEMANYKTQTSRSITSFVSSDTSINIAPGQTSVRLAGKFDSVLKPAKLSYAINWGYTTTQFTPINTNTNEWSITIPASQISGSSFKLTGIINGTPCEWLIGVTRNSSGGTSTNPFFPYFIGGPAQTAIPGVTTFVPNNTPIVGCSS